MLMDTAFCHLLEQYGQINTKKKKLMDTVKKIDAAKTTSKRVVQKTAEATGDLIGNKIADKITLVGTPIKDNKIKKAEEMCISPE